jgi:hypothetical protein
VASKHAAPYTEAHTQHHPVCLNLHTLPCQVLSGELYGGGVGDHGRCQGGCAAASTSTIATNCTLRQGMPDWTTTIFVSREVSTRFAWSTIAHSIDPKIFPTTTSTGSANPIACSIAHPTPTHLLLDHAILTSWTICTHANGRLTFMPNFCVIHIC